MMQSTRYRIDDIFIDLDRRKVLRGKSPIALPSLSFNTLQALVEAAPAHLSAKELVQRAWQGAVVSDDTVFQRIRLLRQALGDDTSQPRYIQTIRNAGYRLIPPVVPVREAGFRPRPWMAAAIIITVTLASAVWYVNTGSNGPLTQPSAPTIPVGPVTTAEMVESARNLLRQRNPASLAHAIDLYEQALVAESENSKVRAGLALALALSVAWYGEKIDVAQRAELLARQALADNVSFSGEMALGLSLDAQGKMEPAQSAYERAVALDPNHYGARASLAYLLQVKGRLVEALSHNIAAMERAPEGNLDVQVASCLRLLGFHSVASGWLERADRLDPDSAHAAPTRALDLITRGKTGQAISVIDQALARGVQQVELYEYKALLAMQNGDLSGARTVLQSAPDSIRHRSPFRVWEHIIAAKADDAHKAAIDLAEAIRSTIEAGDTWPDSHLYVAMLEVAAQRPDKAMAALKNLELAGYRDYLWLEFLPPLRPLRARPEFRTLIASMRSDVEHQRQLVLTAQWLPRELREAGFKQVTALSPSK